MTRYDPFAYGEVRLDPKQQKQAKAKAAAAQGADPDDMLFEAGEAVKQAPPADSSWSLLDEDVEGLLPGAATSTEAVDFGADILGEASVDVEPEAPAGFSDDYAPAAPLDEAMPDAEFAAPAVPEPELMEPQPVVTARPAPARAPEHSAEVAPDDGPRTTSARKRKPLQKPLTLRGQEAEAGDAPRSGMARQTVPYRRRGMPVAAAMLPILLCAGGGTAASWFWVMQSNPVMAGILGAATAVSALFAWLLMRG